MKEWQYHSNKHTYATIKGDDIFDAIEKNFKKLAEDKGVGDAGGYKLKQVTLLPPNKNTTSGGKHFAVLIIKAEGLSLNATPEKTTECWVYCDVNEFKEIKEFDIKVN